MIHEEICTYEVSKLAKEKGFYGPTAKNYRHKNGTTCNAPTQSQLQRWLREEKGIMIEITIWLQSDGSWRYRWKIQTKEDYISSLNDYNTYELALEDCNRYALENLV